MAIAGAFDAYGHPSGRTLRAAVTNATMPPGPSNPVDAALCALDRPEPSNCRKLGEVPCDFVRKRLGILYEETRQRCLVIRCAAFNVLEVCSSVETHAGTSSIEDMCPTLEAQFKGLSKRGLRILGIAVRRNVAEKGPAAERDLTFVGFLALEDPLKSDAAEAIIGRGALGASLKIIPTTTDWPPQTWWQP